MYEVSEGPAYSWDPAGESHSTLLSLEQARAGLDERGEEDLTNRVYIREAEVLFSPSWLLLYSAYSVMMQPSVSSFSLSLLS